MDGKVFLLPCLPQALGGPWHTPPHLRACLLFCNSQGPSVTLCGLGLSSSHWVVTARRGIREPCH